MKVAPRFYFTLLIFFTLLVFPYLSLIAQNANDEENNNIVVMEDSFGRSTPRGTVGGFISAISDQNYELARYLNIPENIGIEESQELAKTFQKMLDMGDLLPSTRISDDSLGRTNDDLEPNLDKVGELETKSDTFDILVERTVNAEGNPIWLFSEQTMEMVANSTELDKELLIDQILPESLKQNTWGGILAGHWLFTFILVFVAYLTAWLITFLLNKAANFIWKKTTREPTLGLISTFTLPLRLYLAVWIFIYGLQRFEVSIILKEKLTNLTMIVGIVAILMFLWRLNKFVGRYTNKKMQERGNSSGVSIIMFLQRFFKAVILIVGFIIILYILGVDVTAGLAALGIGGIALALGAQKSMENFVGSVTLLADQPIRVGDFCKVGGISGTVEKIGIRSTQIRTGERTVITIPNGTLSSESIENYTPRDKFLFEKNIELRAETTPDQIRYILVKIREMLFSHPQITKDTLRIRFTDFGSSSVVLSYYTYVNAANLGESLAIKEDLLLRIIDVVKESGTDFAYPSQTIYIAKDNGISKEKTKSVEEKVNEWRSKNELGNPEFSPEHIEKIKDSIKYPPEGSETSESSDAQTKLDIEE